MINVGHDMLTSYNNFYRYVHFHKCANHNNNKDSTIYAIEAKSITTLSAYIPQDEIQRCYDILDVFSLYKNRFVWFAFKFGVNRSTYQKIENKKGHKIKLNDKKKIYLFKIHNIENLNNINSVSCNSSGQLSILVKNTEKDLPIIRFEIFNDLVNFL